MENKIVSLLNKYVTNNLVPSQIVRSQHLIILIDSVLPDYSSSSIGVQ